MQPVGLAHVVAPSGATRRQGTTATSLQSPPRGERALCKLPQPRPRKAPPRLRLWLRLRLRLRGRRGRREAAAATSPGTCELGLSRAQPGTEPPSPRSRRSPGPRLGPAGSAMAAAAAENLAPAVPYCR